MKKIATIVLIFCAFAFSAAGLLCPTRISRAEKTDVVDTEIFLPTTYLQYYKLESPYAICRETVDDKEFVAISHKGAIVVYTDGTFKSIDISALLPDAVQGVPSLQLFGDYLLFSAQLKLYAVNVKAVYDSSKPVALETVAATDEPVVVCNDFSVQGNVLAVTTNTDVLHYDVSADENGLILSRRSEKISVNNPSAVMLSKNGRTYFYDKDRKQISESDGSTIRKIVDANGVNAIAESPDDDGKIYYSCPEGIFSADVTLLSPAVETIVATSYAVTEDKDLGSIWKPQGLCVTGKGIWVVDSDVNAVQEIDLKQKNDGSYGFTDFAITTNSRAVNRLSENASEITAYDDVVYALDENRIVVIENADDDAESRKYHRLTLSDSPIRFAVGSAQTSEKTTYLAYAYSGGKRLKLGVIAQNSDDENIYDFTEIPVSGFEQSGDGAIVDVCFSNGAFYVLKNSSPDADGGVYPIVYELDVTRQTAEFKELYRIDDKCTAKRIAADVFDTVYLAATNETDGEYVFYACSNGGVKKLCSLSTVGTDILKLQVDFDGKLYVLSSGGVIIRLDGEDSYSQTLRATIVKSANLSDIGSPRSMCLNEQSRSAYFIFGGLILRSSDAEQLGVATLDTIPVPDDFTITFDTETQFGSPVDGAKLFEINVNLLDGKYFDYIEMTEYQGEYEYAFIPLNDKFLLAIRHGLAAVMRASDVKEVRYYKPASATYYAVTNFTAYSMPILTTPYATEISLSAKSPVTVVGTLNFNGDEYFVIEHEGRKAYIPTSFLTDKLSKNTVCDTYKGGYVYNKDGVVLYDNNLHAVGRVLQGETKIKIIDDNGEYVKIELDDGGIYFIRADDLSTESNDNFIKYIVAILCALSFLVLALFFERKYLFETV